MTYRITDPDGDQLIIEPTSRYGRPATSLRIKRSDGSGGAAVHLSARQVDAVITAMRDTVRQAAIQDGQS